MTREEAKTFLLQLNTEKIFNVSEHEAIRVAIQVLSQEPTKEEQTLLQKWRDNRGISIEEFEDAMNTLQEPCDDAISRDELLKAIDTWDKFGCDADTKLVRYQDHYVPYIHYDDVIKCIKGMPSVTQKSGSWIALVARPMTNEEREYYSEQLDYCDGDAAIYNCPLPEEGQEVLITTCTGGVLIDTFFNDCDGCGFEGYDIEDVKAWMPLPEPYKPQESEE